jgi:5'-3' exonuclease
MGFVDSARSASIVWLPPLSIRYYALLRMRTKRLETMEGKALAIDSSIWIYQFQATMRDREGKALVNAHVLGFLRRICKLLFYGIKPVFVFDGGAPALKRNTIVRPKESDTAAMVVLNMPFFLTRPSAKGRRAARL